MTAFACRVQRHPDVTIIRVTGELDLASAPVFEEYVRANRDARRLLVDLGTVTYLDSRGLLALATAGDQIAQVNGRMEIVAGNQNTRKLLAVTGLDELFRVHASETEALAAIDPAAV